MELTAKLAALLEGLQQADIDALPPAHRRRLGALLQYWGNRCDPPKDEAKAGVLANLKDGERAS